MRKNAKFSGIKNPTFIWILIFLFSGLPPSVEGQIKSKKRLVRTSSYLKNQPDKIYLKLKIDGNDIQGECNINSFNRRGSIQCLSFTSALIAPRKPTGQLTGRRQHQPLRITKAIDRTTPQLFKALCNNEPVNSAVFRFFRRTTGGEHHYYTVTLKNAYISTIRHNLKKNLVAGKEVEQMVEQVSLVFQDITWTHPKTGTTHMDTTGRI